VRPSVEALEDRSLLSLVAAFSFNEASGGVLDSSGSGNNGTVEGATRATSGKYGGALSFDGDGDMVTVPDAASLRLATAMTLQAWVQPSASTDYTTVLLKERAGGLAYALYGTDGADKPPAGYLNLGGSDVSVTGTANLPLNAWTHLAVTYDGANLRLYVNATLTSTVAQTGNIISSTGALRIGGNAVWGEWFKGLIDEVRVYDTALTQAQIEADMNTPIGSGDGTPPIVKITGPEAGSDVTGTVTITATASDDTGVAGVRFYLDGQPLGPEDTTAPYSFSWDTTALANGDYTLEAVARDSSGNRTTSVAACVYINHPPDTVAPTARLTGPADNGTVSGTVTVSADASDNVGVYGVQFFLDGKKLGAEDRTAPYSVNWDTTTAGNGAHTLTARARDAYGNWVNSTAVAVIVSNSGAALTIDGAKTFQTIDGFGANVNAHSWKDGEAKPALDLLADQMGATLFRVVYDMVDWEATNDNDDPFTPDWAYYNALYSNDKFQNLWGTLRYLNQKGITTGISLSFMGRVPPWMGGSVITAAAEDEFVETISTLVYYARNTEQVKFGLLDPINEPDWDGIEGPQVGPAQYTRLMRKLIARLDAMGLSDLDLLGPNTASVDAGVKDYMPALMADPVVMDRLDHFAFHNYAGYSAGADAAIKASAYPQKNFWMTETTNPWDIMTHLEGNPSAVMVWDGYDSAYYHPLLRGESFTPPNDAGNGPAPLAYDVATGKYTPRRSFYQTAQIFKYVPPGSVRIGASQPNNNLILYAFYHPGDGRVTIVGENRGGTDVNFLGSLVNLRAPASFQHYHTHDDHLLEREPDVLVTNGSFAFVAAGDSFFTLTGLVTPDTTPPAVVLTAPAGGSTVGGTVTVAADASDNIGLAGVRFYLDGQPLGPEDVSTPYSVSWDTTAVGNGTYTLTAVARDNAGNRTTSAGVTVTVNNPSNGLVGAWGFEEGTGSATADASGNGLHGTLTNAVWVDAGKYGKALSYNGRDAWVTVADNALLRLATGLTIQAWVRPTAASTDFATVALKEGAGSFAYALYGADGANRPPAGYINQGGDDVNVTGDAALPLNTWTHLAVTYDGANLRLYVNGTLAASRAQVGPVTSTTDALRFGGNSVWGEWFTGLIDEVRIHRRALTQDEIRAGMDTPVGSGPSGDPPGDDADEVDLLMAILPAPPAPSGPPPGRDDTILLRQAAGVIGRAGRGGAGLSSPSGGAAEQTVLPPRQGVASPPPASRPTPARATAARDQIFADLDGLAGLPGLLDDDEYDLA
jgi:O-glycosyl hydrolase